MPAYKLDQPAAEAEPRNRAERRAARKGRTAPQDAQHQPEQQGAVHGSQVMVAKQFAGRRGNR